MNDRTALVDVDDVVAQMVDNLERLGNALSSSPKIAAKLDVIRQDAEVLGGALEQNRSVLASLVEVIEMYRKQRDMALNAAEFTRAKRGTIQRELAQDIGLGAGITQRDMERVLEALAGDSDLPVDDELLGRVHDSLHALAQELYEVAALGDSASVGEK